LKVQRPAIYLSFVLLVLFLSIEAAGYYVGSKTSLLTRDEVDRTYTKRSMSWLTSRNRYLKSRVKGLNLHDIYIVVDTGSNRLYIKRGGRVLREAVISSGSGNVLKDPKGKRQWVFDTPRGVFKVQSKYVSPVWTKPDWAFIEEGEKVPDSSIARKEEGVMGDYSLGFGDGYFIHGTLYTRLLGRNVTHGCIRVGDEDLRAVYSASTLGTKIFIF